MCFIFFYKNIKSLKVPILNLFNVIKSLNLKYNFNNIYTYIYYISEKLSVEF